MSARDNAILAALNRGEVAFIVIGVAAAIAHGAELPPDDRQRLDLVPHESEANLRRLAEVLAGQLAATLRIEVDGQRCPAHLDPHAFSVFPVLPLATSAGEVNVVTRPNGTAYQDLANEAVPVKLAGVPVQIASIDALLAGLPGSSRSGNPLVVSELRRLRAVHKLLDLGVVENDTTTGLSAAQRRKLGWAVQTVLARAPEPLAVREILGRLGGPGQVSYLDVRRVAEQLTERGALRRVRVSTSNRYGLNDAHDGQAAREIAALLGDTRDPPLVAQRALELLGAEPDRAPG